MDIRIIHTTEISGGKGYPLTITKIKGLQQIQRHGKPMWVSAVTYHDSREGCTSSVTEYRGPVPQDGVSLNRLPPTVEARLKEVAVQAMVSRGIW